MSIANSITPPGDLTSALGKVRRNGAILAGVFVMVAVYCIGFVPMMDVVSVQAVLRAPAPPIEIHVPRTAMLEDIHVENGTRVDAGQLIAELDTSRLRLDEEDARRRLVLFQLEALRLERQLANRTELDPPAGLSTEVTALRMQHALALQQSQLVSQPIAAKNPSDRQHTDHARRLNELLPLIQSETHRLDGIRLDLAAARIKSPAAGVVRLNGPVVPRSELPEQALLMSILPEDLANALTLEVKPSQVRRLELGTQVEVMLPGSDSFSIHPFSATVAQINAFPTARTSSDNAPNTFVKLKLGAPGEPIDNINLALARSNGLLVEVKIKLTPQTLFLKLYQSLPRHNSATLGK